MPQQNPTRKIGELDSLRGIAALVVVVAHITLCFYPGFPGLTSESPPLPGLVGALNLHSLYGSRLAVLVFFVLSGFVISHSFWKFGNISVLMSGAARRYFRLAVPVFASVMFAYLIYALELNYEREAASVRNTPAELPATLSDWSTRYEIESASLFHGFREGVFGAFFRFDPLHTYNPVLWTMPIELRGSFIVFGALALFGQLRKALGVILILVGVFVATEDYFAADFLIGSLLARIHARHREHFDLPAALSIPLFAVGLFFGGMFATPAILFPNSPDFWNSFGAVAMVAAVAFSNSLGSCLAIKPLEFLGRISFGLYLVHCPILFSLGCFTFYKLRLLDLTQFTAALISGIAVLALSLIVAVLGTLFIDEPAMRYLKVLYSKYFKPLTPDINAQVTGISEKDRQPELV